MLKGLCKLISEDKNMNLDSSKNGQHKTYHNVKANIEKSFQKRTQAIWWAQ